MYYEGFSVPQDSKQAVEWHRKAAEQGNAKAQYNLGVMYEKGKGGSLMYYEDFSVPQDYKQAVEWYRKAAEQGDANAQDKLSVMYEVGIGVPQDSKQAVEWHRKAAEQGYNFAQCLYPGEMYLSGIGVTQDSKQAVDWCRKATEQVQRWMIWLVAIFMVCAFLAYASGEVLGFVLLVSSLIFANWIEHLRECERYLNIFKRELFLTKHKDVKLLGGADKYYMSYYDEEENIAIYEFFKTAKETYEELKIRKDEGYMTDWGSILISDEIPFKLGEVRKAAEQGNANAQYKLGGMYDEGEGVPQDDKQAVEWFRKAAEQGNADAQYNLGVMYEEGKGVPQDDKQAVEWHRKAAEQGHADAQNSLGAAYSNGFSVPQDSKQALEWFRKAAEQGDALAQFNLGVMYEKGEGVPQDFVQAHMWTNISASQEDANFILEGIAKHMSPAQIAQAQELARNWKPSKP